jgi:hypothetical protein
MPGDIESVRLKIKRAKEHIYDLDAKRVAFLDSGAYCAPAKYDPHCSQTVYRVTKYTPVPPYFSLIAGDAIHNLRTALDYLAWQLSASPDAMTCFPICETPEEHETAMRSRKVKSVPEKAKEAMRLLKPYKGGNNAFWQLHRLDIADKHHLLLANVGHVDKWRVNMESSFDELHEIWPGFAMPSVMDVRPFVKIVPVFKQGDELFRLTGNTEVNKDIEVAFNITFRQSEIPESEPIIETLQRFADLIEMTVLPAFAGFF